MKVVTTAVRRTVVLLAAMALGVALAVAGAGSAFADDGITPHDTHGIDIPDYVMSFNEGAGNVLGVAVTPGTTMPAGFMSLAFGAYIAMGWITWTVYKLFIKLDWLSPLVKVAGDLSNSIAKQFGESFIFYVVGATALLTVVLFALRNQRGRAWHHLAITLVCMGIGLVIAFPVGEAAHLLKVGRDIAVSTGGTVTGRTNTDPTGPLIDKFMREPIQRWQYGHDLDSLGCGQTWDGALRAIKAGHLDAEKIKDVPLACPGGQLGQQMHDFTMNPGGALYLGFLNPLFQMLVMVMVAMVVLHIAGTAVSAIIHAALIKPGLLGVGLPAGQSFLARNVIDGYTAAMSTCLYLLVLFVGGSLTGLVAQSQASSDVAMLITSIIMVAAIIGCRKVGRNLRGWKNRAAVSVLPQGAPNAYGAPSKAPEKARQMTVRALQHAAHGRRTTKIARAVGKSAAEAAADAAAPEVMIPAAAAGLAAQHILDAAHHYRAQNAGSYQNGSGAGGSAWGAKRSSKSGGVAGSPAGPGARGVNYSGGAPAAARSVAGRSRQKRATAARERSGATSSMSPGSAGPLRTSAARSGGSASARSQVPVGVGVGPGAAANAGLRRGPQPPSSGGSAPSGAASAGRAGAQAALSRAQSVSTARSAARNFRSRRQ